MTISNRLFFKKQVSNTKIRTMTTFVTIRDLNVNRHSIDEYVLIFFYIIEKNDQKNKICIIFRREVYLINNLKTNILIEINIISSKRIVVDSITRTTKIDSCKIIVSIEIRIFSNVIFKLVYLRKSTTISSRSIISIKIHYFAILENRDFLFKSNKISYFINYIYLIDVTTKTILL